MEGCVPYLIVQWSGIYIHTYISGIKAYNHLPINIKELSYDVKRFKPALKTFFQINSFYSLEEYFSFNPQL